MQRKFAIVSLVFLLALLALVACQGQAAPNDQRFGTLPTATNPPAETPTAVATVDATVVANPTPVGPVATRVITPAGQGNVALPPVRVVPVTGTPVAQSAQIEIITASPQHLTIKPGETASVTPINNSITVMIHYPVPLGDTESGSFQPYPVTIGVDPPDWQPQSRNPPNAQTLHFDLVGSTPGSHTVIVAIPRLGQPVQFTLDIGSVSATPVAANVTPAAMATAAPTVAPASTPAGTRTLTIADNGKTITLRKGDRFLLSLPQGYKWNVSIGDPSVVSYATGFLAPAGTQGLFEAKGVGQTSFSASGEPACRSATPACGLPNRLFQVTIVVK